MLSHCTSQIGFEVFQVRKTALVRSSRNWQSGEDLKQKKQSLSYFTAYRHVGALTCVYSNEIYRSSDKKFDVKLKNIMS